MNMNTIMDDVRTDNAKKIKTLAILTADRTVMKVTDFSGMTVDQQKRLIGVRFFGTACTSGIGPGVRSMTTS